MNKDFTIEELALMREQLVLAVRNNELYDQWNDVARSALEKIKQAAKESA